MSKTQSLIHLSQELDLGFKLDRRRSRRRQSFVITDLDFADDIALLSEEIQKAQDLLTRVENEAAKTGLRLNDEKTEAMVYNIPACTQPSENNWWQRHQDSGDFQIPKIMEGKFGTGH